MCRLVERLMLLAYLYLLLPLGSEMVAKAMTVDLPSITQSTVGTERASGGA